ncbi:hypothetical protein DFH27DRAFT_521859 [Peziza echinospora]|nr:hypothetical protein DFH27DRAFT_521859 [Peziza echinospora]
MSTVCLRGARGNYSAHSVHSVCREAYLDRRHLTTQFLTMKHSLSTVPLLKIQPRHLERICAGHTTRILPVQLISADSLVKGSPGHVVIVSGHLRDPGFGNVPCERCVLWVTSHSYIKVESTSLVSTFEVPEHVHAIAGNVCTLPSKTLGAPPICTDMQSYAYICSCEGRGGPREARGEVGMETRPRCGVPPSPPAISSPAAPASRASSPLLPNHHPPFPASSLAPPTSKSTLPLAASLLLASVAAPASAAQWSRVGPSRGALMQHSPPPSPLRCRAADRSVVLFFFRLGLGKRWPATAPGGMTFGTQWISGVQSTRTTYAHGNQFPTTKMCATQWDAARAKPSGAVIQVSFQDNAPFHFIHVKPPRMAQTRGMSLPWT